MFRRWMRSLIVLVSVFILAGCDVYIEPDVFFESDVFMEESIIGEESIEDSVPENEPPETTGKMEVHFIDVGQGDATLVICDDEAMLIDAAPSGNGTLLQSYLRKRGVTELEYLILTHTDADHIGSASVIVNKFDIHTVFMGDFPKDNKTYRGLLEAFSYYNLTYSTPNVGNVYSLGEATFTIVAPNREYDNPNDSSIALVLQHGENKFLFTGDAKEDAEQDMLANGLDLDCDVYKAGHHGSSTSSCEDFLSAATPEYSVISCEAGNSYGHPHAEVLNNFRKMGIKVFRTDEQGSIVAYSDGENITWNCAPSESWQVGE